MKIKYILFVIILSISGCAPAYESVIGNNERKQYQKLISPYFEKLDTSLFDRMHKRNIPKKISESGSYRISDNDTTLYRDDGGEENLTIYKTLYAIEGSIAISHSNNSFTEWDYLSKDVYVIKWYYSDGAIKIKEIKSKYGFRLGRYYEFNKEGTLIKNIDTDKGFDFSYSDVLVFCKQNKIILDEHGNNSGWIDKNLKNKTWFIKTRGPGGGYYDTFTIDGKTGKLIKKGPAPLEIE